MLIESVWDSGVSKSRVTTLASVSRGCWRYSVISAIATAPFNHVVNMLPARDEAEFRAFAEADQKWFRDWFDWTDRNLELLRSVKPILGAPQLGRVDGTAAFKNGRGVVFLFNPNYRVVPAEFVLDGTIGLSSGKRFALRQLHPDAERGRLFAPPSGDADTEFAVRVRRFRNRMTGAGALRRASSKPPRSVPEAAE